MSAACAGTDLELWFGHDGEPDADRLAREAQARQVCASCPIKDSCLAGAIGRREKDGIWGGTTCEERTVLRRNQLRRANRRRKKAKAAA